MPRVLKYRFLRCRLVLPVLCVIWVLHAPMACAIKLDTLYQSSVVVPTNEKLAKEKENLRQAFKDVLVKVASHESILSLADVNTALEKVDQYVSQFHYKQVDADHVEQIIKFNPKIIHQLLKANHETYLSQNRPLTLVWLAINDENPYLIGEERGQDISRQLQYESNKVGIPLAVPLMDLTDRMKVSPTHINQFNQNVIKLGSKRYQANLILSGILTHKEDAWFGQWHLLTEDGEPATSWNTRGDTLLENFTQLMTTYSELLKNRYAPQVAQDAVQQHIRIRVAGVESLDSYAETLKYFKGLQSVNQVRVQLVEDDVVEYSIEYHGNEETLMNSISLSKKLISTPEQDVYSSGQAAGLLNFKLNT